MSTVNNNKQATNKQNNKNKQTNKQTSVDVRAALTSSVTHTHTHTVWVTVILQVWAGDTLIKLVSRFIFIDLYIKTVFIGAAEWSRGHSLLRVVFTLPTALLTSLQGRFLQTDRLWLNLTFCWTVCFNIQNQHKNIKNKQTKKRPEPELKTHIHLIVSTVRHRTWQTYHHTHTHMHTHAHAHTHMRAHAHTQNIILHSHNRQMIWGLFW